MTLQVIGAGMPRTGTMSTKAALEQLGFGGCYHFIDLIMGPDKVPYWEAASRGESVPWEELFEGWHSTMDFPSSSYYRQFMELYPAAKVVLNVRDPELWYESLETTVYQVMLRVFGPDGTEANAPGFKGDPELLHRVMKFLRHDFFEVALGGNFRDKEATIGAFLRHNEEVQATVPAEKLLVFEVTQGWEPLCKFLDVPVPEAPFPRLNDRVTFTARLEPLS